MNAYERIGSFILPTLFDEEPDFCVLNVGDFISREEKQVLEYDFVFTPFAFHGQMNFTNGVQNTLLLNFTTS